jgi:hypothetical protein
MKNVQDFLLMCSGADRSILKRSPSDINKQVGLGGCILFTAVFAFLAAAYAVHLIFDQLLLSIVVGLLWATMIFNLDRFIVSSMKHKGSFLSRLFLASPRIVMAVLIAFVMATPIELRLFEKEINTELTMMQEEERMAQKKAIEQRFSDDLSFKLGQMEQIQASLTLAELEKNKLLQDALKEADGTGGSQQRNMGPIYRLKMDAAESTAKEFDLLRSDADLRLAALNEDFIELESKKAEAFEQLPEPDFGGIAGRIQALDRLSDTYPKVGIAHQFIFLLFLMIECSPLLVKLISSRSPYDLHLNQHELSAELHSKELSTIRQHDLEEKLKYHTQISTAKMNAQIKKERAKIEADLREHLEHWKA